MSLSLELTLSVTPRVGRPRWTMYSESTTPTFFVRSPCCIDWLIHDMIKVMSAQKKNKLINDHTYLSTVTQQLVETPCMDQVILDQVPDTSPCSFGEHRNHHFYPAVIILHIHRIETKGNTIIIIKLNKRNWQCLLKEGVRLGHQVPDTWRFSATAITPSTASKLVYSPDMKLKSSSDFHLMLPTYLWSTLVTTFSYINE